MPVESAPVSLAQINNMKGSSSEDLKFLESNAVKNHNEMYHLDYQIKKMDA